MEVAKIKINGTSAEVSELKTITTGMVGASVSIEYDDTWDGLHKQVVFRTHFRTVNADGTMLPHTLLTYSGTPLQVGVYGYTSDGSIAIPTVWASLGNIKPGADPEGDEAAKPTLPVWARMQAQITALESAAEVISSILPAVTAQDAGKALVVSADGKIIADDGMVEQDVLPEQVLTFAVQEPDNPENPYVAIPEETPFNFRVGETYYVVWDGVVYQCLAKQFVEDEIKYVYIGNAELSSIGDATEEPFCIEDVYANDTLQASGVPTHRGC